MQWVKAVICLCLLIPGRGNAATIEARRVGDMLLGDIRHIAVAYGVPVPACSPDNQLDLRRGTRSVSFQLYTFAAIVNDRAVLLDAAPFREGRRIFVPIQTTADALGGKLSPAGRQVLMIGAVVHPVKVLSDPLPPTDPLIEFCSDWTGRRWISKARLKRLNRMFRWWKPHGHTPTP